MIDHFIQRFKTRKQISGIWCLISCIIVWILAGISLILKRYHVNVSDLIGIEMDDDIRNIYGHYGSINVNFTGNVFITGIAGFIGMHTAKIIALKMNKTKIIGIDSFNSYYSINLKREREQILNRLNVTVIHGNLCDKDLLQNIFDTYNVSIVLHFAAQAGVRHSVKYPFSYTKNNIDCTLQMFEVIKDLDTKPIVIYASSSSVYGFHDSTPFNENDILNPKSIYATSKIATENLGLMYGYMYNITTTGLRFFTVYGSYGRPDMALWLFTEKLMNNKSIYLYNNGNMFRDFTHVSDIVDGILRATQYAMNKHNNPDVKRDHLYYKEIFNLGKGNVRRLREFVNIILTELVSKMDVHIKGNLIKYRDKTPNGEVSLTSADIAKAKRYLGFYPKIELESGIPEFMEWYHNDWLKYKKYARNINLLITVINNDDGNIINNIQQWYHSWINIINDDKYLTTIDIVIIHNGLHYKYMTNFNNNIIFIDVGYPNKPIKYESILNYLNEYEYYYKYIIISSIHSKIFNITTNPFKILHNKPHNSNRIINTCPDIIGYNASIIKHLQNIKHNPFQHKCQT